MKLIKGYINVAKLKLGSSVCSDTCSNKCPYWNKGCSQLLARDCLSYIIFLERSVNYEEKKQKS